MVRPNGVLCCSTVTSTRSLPQAPQLSPLIESRVDRSDLAIGIEDSAGDRVEDFDLSQVHLRVAKVGSGIDDGGARIRAGVSSRNGKNRTLRPS